MFFCPLLTDPLMKIELVFCYLSVVTSTWYLASGVIHKLFYILKYFSGNLTCLFQTHFYCDTFFIWIFLYVFLTRHCVWRQTAARGLKSACFTHWEALVAIIRVNTERGLSGLTEISQDCGKVLNPMRTESLVLSKRFSTSWLNVWVIWTRMSVRISVFYRAALVFAVELYW